MTGRRPGPVGSHDALSEDGLSRSRQARSAQRADALRQTLANPPALPPGPLGAQAQPLEDFPKGKPVTAAIKDGYKIKITFDPRKSNRARQADRINFHQIVQIWARDKNDKQLILKPSQITDDWKACDDWLSEEQWFVDVYKDTPGSYYIKEGYDRKGYYRTGGDFGRINHAHGTADKNAVLDDEPAINDSSVARRLLYDKDLNPKGLYHQLWFYFYSHAVCQQGDDKNAGRWYEGLGWQWTLSAKWYYDARNRAGHGVSTYYDPVIGYPYPFFSKAVKKYWAVKGRD